MSKHLEHLLDLLEHALARHEHDHVVAALDHGVVVRDDDLLARRGPGTRHLAHDDSTITKGFENQPALRENLRRAAQAFDLHWIEIDYLRNQQRLGRYSPFGTLAFHPLVDKAFMRGMLVHQGARAFTLWPGAAAPIEVMRCARARAIDGPPR